MPAINFQARWADDVAKGRKRTTIRPERRYPIEPGHTLHLYTGQRTKQCRALGKWLCLGVTSVTITPIGAIWLGGVLS